MRHFVVLALVALLQSLVTPPALANGSVNVYSARHDALIEPLLEQFSERTGIDVGLITGNSDAMIKRLQIEGRNSPADVLIAIDAARLHRAESAGLFQPVTSPALPERIPSHLRDPENLWFGLSLRARVIAYSRERVDPASLSTYEALADPEWKNRICIRSSDNVYNQSLLASLVAAHGEAEAEAWARGIVDNMARKPQGGDTEQIRALAADICDVAIVNTYYYARMLESEDPEQRAVAEQVGLFFPNQDGRGTHVNVTGAGVLRHAPNRDNAVRLLEFLTTPEAQRWLARVNHEYPVHPDVEASETVRSLGRYPFRQDHVSLGRIGDLNATAVRIFDRVGWR